jgi:hypothetical protein
MAVKMVRSPGLEFPTTFELECSSRFPTTSELDVIAGSVAGINERLTDVRIADGFKAYQ